MKNAIGAFHKQPKAPPVVAHKRFWKKPFLLSEKSELLMSSIGACIAITVQMYAARKQWPLQGITVELVHKKMKAEECPDCKSEKGQVSEITTKISLSGDLTEDQKKRILEIAGKCPVKRTIENEVIFRSSLAT